MSNREQNRPIQRDLIRSAVRIAVDASGDAILRLSWLYREQTAMAQGEDKAAA